MVTKSFKGAIADPLTKYQLFVWQCSLCSVTKSFKEAVADPTWVQSTIATILSLY